MESSEIGQQSDYLAEGTATNLRELHELNRQATEAAVMKHFKFMPPPRGHCQVCAVKHPRTAPHNAQSMFYHAAFWRAQQRQPTWADAIAHCDADTQERWRVCLLVDGHWSEPENGEAIAHLGEDDNRKR